MANVNILLSDDSFPLLNKYRKHWKTRLVEDYVKELPEIIVGSEHYINDSEVKGKRFLFTITEYDTEIQLVYLSWGGVIS